MHCYEHGRIGRYEVKEPLILGHELAGVVVRTGEKVRNVSARDRVAVEPGVTCGRCSYCKSGRYNLCPDVVFMATPPVDGAWAEYVAVRSDFLFRLPDGMSFEEGALVDAELDIYGVFRYANTYPAAIQMLQNKGSRIRDIITHQFSLDQIEEAIELARTQKDTSVKVMIYPHQNA